MVLPLKDICLHAAILLQFRYTASVKKADTLNPCKPRKGNKIMSDTPKPERHIEVKLINSGRVLRTQTLGEYADKMFDSMMRSILHMSMLHGPACDLGTFLFRLTLSSGLKSSRTNSSPRGSTVNQNIKQQEREDHGLLHGTQARNR